MPLATQPDIVTPSTSAAAAAMADAALNADLSSPTTSLIPFPSVQSEQQALRSLASGSQATIAYRRKRELSTLSLASRFSMPNRLATLEVYELMYGSAAQTQTPADVMVERLYETNAGEYENPLVTASSRQIITDINVLTRQMAKVDVPRPLAMFKTLFRPGSGGGEEREPWFQALRVWSDIEDICDSNSFDGHQMCIIEHTMNVLLLPGMHTDTSATGSDDYDGWDYLSTATSAGLASASTPFIAGPAPPPKPSLALPGFEALSIPSPFHLKLHVLTRLSFNEQGRITRHRDYWDVRDVLGLVPGMQVAQWLGTRAAAQGLSLATQLTSWVFRRGAKGSARAASEDVERCGGGELPATGATSAASSSRGEVNALGLQLDEETVRRASTSGSVHMKLLSEGSQTRGTGPPYATPRWGAR